MNNIYINIKDVAEAKGLKSTRWIKFHNNQPCPNDRTKTIKECLNSVQKQNIDVQILDDLMMKTEGRTINKHGITFLNMHYRSEAILGIRDKVNIRYSLFDLSKVNVYSKKGEFLCVAHRVQKVHPMLTEIFFCLSIKYPSLLVCVYISSNKYFATFFTNHPLAPIS